MTAKQKRNLVRIIISAVALVTLCILPVSGWVRLGLFLLCYGYIGHDVLKKAVRDVLNGKFFNENFLMAVATVGAFALAIITQSGDYAEGVAVILFYQVGEWFQSYAVHNSRKSIYALMDIRPDVANLVSGETVQKMHPSEVAVGSRILVNVGERIPLDGVIEKGETSLDQSALTGESLPVFAQKGSVALSGSINLSSPIEIVTTSTFGQSTASKILELVENASSKKSVCENFISKFSRKYTPAVCFGALALAVLPPLVVFALGGGLTFGVWAYRALTFLVISCPCALVISVPLTFFAGLGSASKNGVLVKGSNYLEILASLNCAVFDKTGTLTKGEFTVSRILPNSLTENQLLEYVALCESASTHPIAQGVLRAYEKPVNRARVGLLTEFGGMGVVAQIDDKQVAVGNARLMEKVGAVPNKSFDGVFVLVAINGVFEGAITLSDTPKKQAETLVEQLGKVGVKKVFMLTGDNEMSANQVARALHVTNVFANLLPSDKLHKVESIISAQNRGEKVAFVGDGINDAPSLARADVGVAMGGVGSDMAISSADVVIMDDNPQKLVTAIKISKKTLRIVKQNVWFALGVKALCLALGAVGIANMWLAIVADVGVMVLAVLNALRAQRT